MTLDLESDLSETEEYLKIDKISDDVFAIAPNIVLKFNVSLSKISGGKRYHYHNEYEYNSPSANQQLVTIKRSFDYYLSFEAHKKDDNGIKTFIRIGPQEYFSLMKNMDIVESWFTNKKFNKLFAYADNGALIMTSPIPSIQLGNLPMGKYITFTPCVIDKGIANADKEPGIEMNFNGENEVQINLDKFMGLKYILSCFNMYQAAITLLNYNNHPSRVNRVVMSLPQKMTIKPVEQTELSGGSGINDRYVTPKGVKSNISSLEG